MLYGGLMRSGLFLYDVNGIKGQSIMGFDVNKDCTKNPLAEDFLKKAGEEGWEVVSVLQSEGFFRFLFKRELEN